MPYSPLASEFEVTLEPASTAVATVMLLHGLGADGLDFVPIVEEFGLPMPVRTIFPHAPERLATVTAGYVMRAWYDIQSFTPEARTVLAGQGNPVEWHEYPMEHEVCAAELAEMAQWLRGRLAVAEFR